MATLRNAAAGLLRLNGFNAIKETTEWICRDRNRALPLRATWSDNRLHTANMTLPCPITTDDGQVGGSSVHRAVRRRSAGPRDRQGCAEPALYLISYAAK